MAYLRNIDRPHCDTCKVRYATKTLVNRYNSRNGDYCAVCATKALRDLLKAERDSISTTPP